MNTSPTIGLIAKALATAQAEIENVGKDAVNTQFAKPDTKGPLRPSYATLAAVLDVCRPVLAKNGIALIQSPGNDGEAVTLTTTLAHESGEWFQSTVGVIPGKRDAQGLGSALTYLRRYSLSAICGVAQEDDDGNAASAHAAPSTRPANDRWAPSTAPRQSATVVGHSGKPPLDQQQAKKEQARQEIRDNIKWMSAAHEERELLANLDNLTDDDLRVEYKRIKEARKAIETQDLPA